MGIELKITAKGQVTLKQSVLEHLGVQPGDKVDVEQLPDGRVQLKAASERPDIMRLFGVLWRPGQRVVSLEEMEEGIAAGAIASAMGEDDD
jgi:bifunctional DNA-binding transcriptional regulator/antitoxin component of YhaV-PrlF toxin-antitoxin module